jgi:hypothetical protein
MTDHDAKHCLDCNPGATQDGDGMTVQPGEWTPIDDNGTEIYVYGEQPVDIVVRLTA